MEVKAFEVLASLSTLTVINKLGNNVQISMNILCHNSMNQHDVRKQSIHLACCRNLCDNYVFYAILRSDTFPMHSRKVRKPLLSAIYSTINLRHRFDAAVEIIII